MDKMGKFGIEFVHNIVKERKIDMKRILSLVLVMLSIEMYSCPPPTAHGLVSVGACYDYMGQWSAQEIGLCGRLGIEEPYRYVSIYGVGSYMFGSGKWSVGGEVSVNPLGIVCGYETPINFAIIGGFGYKSYIQNNWYGRVGLELSGRLGKIVSPYVSCSCDINNNMNEVSCVMSAGVRIWIGKDW